jgi:hypothetical protein
MQQRIFTETIFSSVDTLGTWLRATVMDGLSADAAQNIGVSMAQLAY